MTTGLPSQTARHSGLPGFSATPCAMMPGLPSRAMMRWETSPAPFDVPPDSTSMSLASSALRIADSSCASSSGMAPRNTASPPFSADRRGDDRAVGVVDRGRAQRLARLHQFIAGREDGDARPARDGHLRDAAGRQHADLARADDGAGAQQRLAARDVGAGIGDELPGRSGAADLDRAMALPAGYARPSRRRPRRAAPGRRSRSTSPCPTTPAASARCRRR